MNKPITPKKPISQLYDECQQQVQRFKRGRAEEQSLSCLEIVRQATKLVDEALHYLLLMVQEVAQSKARQRNAFDPDDVVQQTSEQVLKRFQNKQSPFEARTYADFVQFINVVTGNIVSRQAKLRDPASLEALNASMGFEPPAPSHIDEVESRMLAQQVLRLLKDDLERKVIYHRFMLGESPDDIVVSLRQDYSDLTKQKVYKKLEHALRRLRKEPALRTFFYG